MTGVPDWGRLYRTVRHLPPRQIAARAFLAARYHLYQRFPRAAHRGLAGPAFPDAGGLDRVGRWMATKYPGQLSPGQRTLATGAAERRFTFLNRAADPAPGPVDWQAGGMSHLWQYHLHYADYVAALALGVAHGEDPRWSDHALDLIVDWIEGNPPGRRPGWDAYPLSLRAVNWVTALALLGPRMDEARRARLAASLAAQGRFLARHLEWHLGGNHLVKNAKALLVLGTALECREARAWRARGLEILFDEMRRQILADGGHYERSPLYHGIVLEDLLDVLVLASGLPAGVPGRVDLEELRSVAMRMADWLFLMRHADGGLALFNDCVEAGEPAPGPLLEYARRVLGHEPSGRGSAALAASGYYILERGDGRAVIDCGEVGPDELPAHAHADTLSFELSWAGRRVVVDSGTPEYALDDLRRYVRSTAAHSTVEVDGVEQSEVWASHRVGRRARPAVARIAEAADHARFAGAHDGYARLGVFHHRHIVATDRAWIVVDELRGQGRHRFESRLHFHPGFRLEARGQGWRAIGEPDDFEVRPLGAVTGEVVQGRYCPDWNRVEPAPVLTLRGAAEAPVAFGYVLSRGGEQVDLGLDADAGGVTLTGRVGGQSLNLRSERCTFSS